MTALTLDLVLLQLFTGVALGAVFVIMAVGLSLIFGLLTVVNFAHGAFYMVGAYLGVWLLGLTGNFWLCLAAVPLLAGAVGLLVERVMVRPLYGRGVDYPLLLTYGLALVLVEAIRILFGTEGLPFGMPRALRGAVDLGFGHFPLYRLFVMAVAALVLAALWLLLEKTSWGLVIRAGARDPEIARILGVDISRVWLVVFGIGTGLAGLSGLLAAPMRGVSPEMGVPVLVEAFVVTVVGGMGSLVGAVVAGLLVGVVVSMASLLAPGMAEVAMFGLMALVLLVRPQGLFGRAGLMG
jgi:branched-chain amino acid transport system permease protein